MQEDSLFISVLPTCLYDIYVGKLVLYPHSYCMLGTWLTIIGLNDNIYMRTMYQDVCIAYYELLNQS